MSHRKCFPFNKFFKKIHVKHLTTYTMQCIVLDKAEYYMDSQLKKGVLEVCVLHAISKSESYGYKIISDLQGIIEMSESTLYPILKRLETGGFLVTRTAEHNGRLRRYYKITPLGLKKLVSGRNDLLEINVIYKKLFGGKL